MRSKIIFYHFFAFLFISTNCSERRLVGNNNALFDTNERSNDGKDENEKSDCSSVEEKRSLEEFPEDLLTEYDRRHGAIVVHVIVGFYCFVLIAFVCNDYFLPSVYCICEDLNLSHDIAGATFMATATCAPEMFVNLIGTFLTESDLGIGTVVGSAMCNILAVTACAGLAATKSIKLEVWPLVRDSSIYILVVGLLAFILSDSIVEWWEAALLLLFYLLYFVLMFTQRKLYSIYEKLRAFCAGGGDSMKECNNDSILTIHAPCYGTYRQFYFTDYAWPIEAPASDKIKNVHENGVTLEANDSKSSGNRGIFQSPEGIARKVWWTLSLPIAALLFVSIPDCRVNRKSYPISFFMCVFWIGVTSYVVSWMMAILGDTLYINDAVMGLTFLAIGGSIPETASAIVNARNGVGSMTISNALGANTLDILLCLGAPWLIKTLIPLRYNGGPIKLATESLAFNCVCLIFCVLFLNAIAYCNSFKMNRIFGGLCLTMYLISAVVLVLVDTNVLFNFNSSRSC